MSNKSIYEKLIKKTLEFHEIRDIDLLLEKILQETRKFLNADAGTIYIKEDNDLLFKYAQNDTLKEKGEIKYKKFKIPINDYSIAGFCANHNEILNIKDVYLIEKNSPYQFNRKFDKLTGYRTKSMLVAPLHSFEGEVIGVIQIINKKDEDGNIIPFSEIDEKIIIKYFSSQASHAMEKAFQTRRMILKMIEMSKLRDPSETGMHVTRVGEYSIELYETWARKNGIDEDKIIKNKDILKFAAMLHDVGKVGISDKILKKPGKLTDEEYHIMKGHTIYGAKLFTPPKDKFEKACQEVALNHHERWDGKGYPGKVDLHSSEVFNQIGKFPKKGKEIPLFGRIVAIADVFDALVSKRCYKEAYPVEKSIEIIKENSGTQFDPELVNCFLNITDKFKLIHNFYQE